MVMSLSVREVFISTIVNNMSITYDLSIYENDY